MRNVFIILVSLFFLGCEQTHQKPLSIGYNDWIGYQPLSIAEHKGYFHGLVETVSIPNSSEGMRLFRNHILDGVTLTLDEAILLHQETHDVSIILVMDYSNGADAMLSQSDIKQLKQIKGKKIGFERSAVGALMLTKILEKSALTLQEIIPVNLYYHEHLSAFKNKRVDAVITFEPAKSAIKALGGNILFDSSEIPSNIIDVLVVRKSLFQKNDPRIQTLLKVWDKTLLELPNSEFLAKQLAVTSDELNKLFSDIKLLNTQESYDLLLKKRRLHSICQDLLKTMHKSKLIKQELNLDSQELISHEILQSYVP